MTQIAPPNSPTISDDIYHLIKQDIIKGKFSPGAKLAIKEMCARYHVGNSPLREALTKLAATGLIQQQNQRGFRIPLISGKDLADICDSRIHIEGAALKMAIAKGDDYWEAQILAQFHQLQKCQQQEDVDQAEWESRHSRFHNALIEACDSPSLLGFCNILHDQFDRYRRLAPIDLKIRAELDAQHREIMQLSIAREATKAGELLAEHIKLSARAAMAMFGNR